MNFFEAELRKIMEQSTMLTDRKYVGRACYGRITDDLRARIELVSMGTHEHYDGVKTSIINRKEGVVDSILMRFKDTLGAKQVANPNFKDGIYPHIWHCDGEYEWYVYQPVKADYQKLSCGIESYLSVFGDMEPVQEAGQQMNL